MFGHHHLAVGLLAVSSLAAGQTTAPKCRCIYGESCWPSQSTFSTLQGQLSQPLINVVPPASACYPAGNPSGDCASVLTNFADGGWRADQPGAMQSPSWEAFLFPNGTLEGCYMNTTLGLPCLQGNVPPIGVDAKNAADVQAAVAFASKNNLKLVVKNTGHDYLGRSAGRGAFMLWTHHLKDKSFNKQFVPTGAPRTERKTYQAVTFGSGIQWGEAYEFVNQQGRFILGGISMGGTVGAAGGWILGAGHSTFAPTFGFGVDNVLEFKVVLADGKLATVNAFQNPDLWWALRGGGGGTFGVLISVTYQTHDIFPFAQSTLSATFDTPEIAQRVVTQFIKLQPTLADLGWGGFTFFTAAGIQVNYVAPNYDSVKAQAAFSPFANFVTNVTAGQTQVGYTEFGNFPDWFQVVFAGGPAQVGSPTEVTGRLLQRDMAENHADEVARVLLSINDIVGAFSVAGGAASKPNPDAMALHPSWRKTVTNIQANVVWEDGAPASVVRQQIETLKRKTDILDRINTDSAAYLNEATRYEKDFKKSFWGSHYSRARSIKAKYDPRSLFIVPGGIGADEWDSEQRCRL